jgi:hypothetical protein
MKHPKPVFSFLSIAAASMMIIIISFSFVPVSADPLVYSTMIIQVWS